VSLASSGHEESYLSTLEVQKEKDAKAKIPRGRDRKSIPRPSRLKVAEAKIWTEMSNSLATSGGLCGDSSTPLSITAALVSRRLTDRPRWPIALSEICLGEFPKTNRNSGTSTFLKWSLPSTV